MDFGVAVQIATLLLVLGGIIGGLARFSSSTVVLAAKLESLEDKSAEDTQQIRVDLQAFADKNDSAHAGLHTRLNTLPCSEQAQRISKLEGTVNGLKKRGP